MSDADPKISAASADRLALLIAEAEGAYAALKQAAEASVVRSEWTSGPRYAEEPAFFEIQKMRRGQRLGQRPLDPARCRQYGFDSEGRVVVERRPVEIAGRWTADETFSRHEPDGIARFHFGHGESKRWINCAWIHHGPLGVDLVHTAFANERQQIAVYRYGEGDRVETVAFHRTAPGLADTVEYRDLAYDEAGVITRVVWRTATGDTHLHYERPAETDRLLAAQARLIDGLADAIVAALAHASIEAPLAVIALSTSGAHEQRRFPPIVSFATEATLLAVRDALGPGAVASLWNPAEWPEANELALDLDAGLVALCASVSQDIWQNDLHAQADHTLLRLAATIEKRDLPVTRAEPFAAVVLEIDGTEEAATQVAAQIGKEAREAWRGRGLL